MSTFSPTRRSPKTGPEDAHRTLPSQRDQGPLFEQPAPEAAPAAPTAKPPVTVAISAVLDGFPITLSFVGQADQLPAAIARLRSVGALPPSQKLEWSYTPEGLPICSKHGTPMKKREKQGDTWYSHVVTDAYGEEIYCRGYHGKDSPGYDC